MNPHYRRRCGGSENILSKTYLERDQTRNLDVERALTNTEEILCRSFIRIELRGKRGRRLPVVFTPNMQYNVELLIQTRKCDYVENNQPLFAIPRSKESYLKGSNTLRRHAKACGAKVSDTISPTKLWNHVVTINQLHGTWHFHSQRILQRFTKITREHYSNC